MRIGRLSRRMVTVVTAAAIGVVVAPMTAHAAPTTVPYLCPVTTEDGTPLVLNYQRGYDVTAPATVHRNERFSITIDSEPINPLPEFNAEVWDVKFVFTLPEDATYLSHKLVGGSNLGGSQQSVQVVGDRIEYRASGLFTAGEDADLPNLVVKLRAPHHQATLVTAPAGTSYDDPGFRWTSSDPATGDPHDLQCYPDPAQPVTLSSTTVD